MMLNESLLLRNGRAAALWLGLALAAALLENLLGGLLNNHWWFLPSLVCLAAVLFIHIKNKEDAIIFLLVLGAINALYTDSFVSMPGLLGAFLLVWLTGQVIDFRFGQSFFIQLAIFAFGLTFIEGLFQLNENFEIIALTYVTFSKTVSTVGLAALFWLAGKLTARKFKSNVGI